MDDHNLVQIIVAGHTVLKNIPDADPLTEEGLELLDYQKDGVHYLIFQEHVRHSLKLTQQYLDNGWQVQLIFSGGISREESPYSEAETYLMIAERLDEWRSEFAELVVLEEYARDSYENVLYGCAAGFAKVSGTDAARIPDEVLMVSFKFKCQRFNAHAAAIGLLPEELLTEENSLPVFRYHGVCNPPNLGGALVGEANAIQLHLFDPHGLSPAAQEKRKERNPQDRHQSYTEEVKDWPALYGLLRINAML